MTNDEREEIAEKLKAEGLPIPPQSRADCIVLLRRVSEELQKINRLFEEAFKRCEEAQLAESIK